MPTDTSVPSASSTAPAASAVSLPVLHLTDHVTLDTPQANIGGESQLVSIPDWLDPGWVFNTTTPSVASAVSQSSAQPASMSMWSGPPIFPAAQYSSSVVTSTQPFTPLSSSVAGGHEFSGHNTSQMMLPPPERTNHYSLPCLTSAQAYNVSTICSSRRHCRRRSSGSNNGCCV